MKFCGQKFKDSKKKSKEKQFLKQGVNSSDYLTY